MSDIRVADDGVGPLEQMLQRLAGYYTDPEHEEIAINRPGEVWCRLRKQSVDGRLWIRVDDPRLDRAYLASVCWAVANTTNQHFHPTDQKRPSSIFATLGEAGHRFAAVMGNVVQYGAADPLGGIGICIRQGSNERTRVVNMEAWGVKLGDGVEHSVDRDTTITDPQVDAHRTIREALALGYDLLVSGGMSTGKTQFLNNIIDSLNPDLRIITVEDTREIMLPKHPNHCHLLLPRTEGGSRFTYLSAIDIITRFTPDAVLVGEISTTNAAALWNLSGIGHGSMMCTIHASNADEAYAKLVDRVAQSSGHDIDRAKMLADAQEKFCVVQLEREIDGRRIMTDVRRPKPKRDVTQRALSIGI